MTVRRFLLAGLLLFAAFPAMAGDKVHHLALQISDNSPDKMNTVLGNATNAAHYYAEKGEKLEIKVVAYSGGLNMLRTDKSPVLERLKSVSQRCAQHHLRGLQQHARGHGQEGRQEAVGDSAGAGHEGRAGGRGRADGAQRGGWTIVRP